jgi:U2-associated protein SR140
MSSSRKSWPFWRYGRDGKYTQTRTVLISRIVFTQDVLDRLRNLFMGTAQLQTKPEDKAQKGLEKVKAPAKSQTSGFKTSGFKSSFKPLSAAAMTEDLDGEPIGADIDGEAMEDVDGEEMGDKPESPVVEDLDGEAMDEDVDGEAMDLDDDDLDGEAMT